ncbi:MAG: adenine deaminase [Deltaproteobacteria bacterium]|nr:adenine deaminase [Candidatus Anaeroferrophillus wilburensis]MBN2889108.1 adenine deaminase [Deltaproteobacteria bacterium]
MDAARLISLARGSEQVDLLLTNLRLVDVISGEIFPTEIAIAGTTIAGIGFGYGGRKVLDLQNRYVCPGFIDAHVHVESSLLRPCEFARAVVPHGVTTVVSNPHEIANVCGLEGIYFMLADGKRSPLTTYVTIPSCVPATNLATSGAELSLAAIARLQAEPQVIGLGEVMDVHGLLAGDGRVLAELDRFRSQIIDGHCPGLQGRDLNAYVVAGITSDHECSTVAEAQEKLRAGISLFIREGSVAHNLEALAPMITPDNERWFSFCTDDRQPIDLQGEGSIDHLVRLAVSYGVPPLTAIRLATINPAVHFRLSDRGAVTPGRRADLIVFSDLQRLKTELVFQDGVLRARDGECLSAVAGDCAQQDAAWQMQDTVHVNWSRVDWRIPRQGPQMRVIGVVPGQLSTETLMLAPATAGGQVVADPERDVAKMMVIERHRASGRVGRGFVHGLGLQRGALASTVAHDHHNLMVVGIDNRSMKTAARTAAASGGGQAVALGDHILAHLPLPIAGLMASASLEDVCFQVGLLTAAVHTLGSPLPDPFMTMSFLGLEVIPSLKLTDRGLVDVNSQSFVPLFSAS